MGPSPLQLCMDYGDYSQDQREMKMPPSMADMMGCSASSPAAFLGAAAERKPKPQPEQALKCPRCNSNNTKFCYYNNYSLSQPRYFCKTCRRYWTQGGALRNVPVGGGCRKNKKSGTSSSSSTPKKPSSDTAPGLTAADMGAPACFGFAPMGPPVCTDGFSPAPDIFGLGRPGYDGHHIIPGFSSDNSACSSSSGSQNLASLLASMHANSRTISPPASASDLLWRLQGRPKFDSPAPAPGMMLRFHENRDEGLTTAQFITDPKASSSSSSMLNPRFGFCDGYEGGPPASAVKSETAAWHGDASAAAAAAAAAAEISPSKESIFCNDKSSSSSAAAAAAAAAALPFLYSCHSSSVSSLM